MAIGTCRGKKKRRSRREHRRASAFECGTNRLFHLWDRLSSRSLSRVLFSYDVHRGAFDGFGFDELVGRVAQLGVVLVDCKAHRAADFSAVTRNRAVAT